MSTPRAASAKRYWRKLLLAFCVAGAFQNVQLYAQELQFDEEEPATMEVRSSVRHARTPANRNRGASNRQQLRIAVEESVTEEDLSAPGVRLSSSQAPKKIISSQIEPEPVALPESVQPAPVPQYEDSSLSEYIDQELIGGDCGCDSCGQSSCDGMCGFSICNQPSCGAYGPRLAFINPLVDPAGFGCSILNRMQFRVTSVQFWKTDANLPPLATTDTNPALAEPGRRGGPSTQVLFGNKRLQGGAKNGIRAEFTLWLDPARERAAWFRMYDSGDQVSSGNFNSNTTPIIARPFFDLQTNAENTLLVARPANGNLPLREGSLDISLKSNIQGGDLMVRRRIYEDDLVRSDFLWGYQQVRFSESLQIDTRITTAPGLATVEYFSATNQFNGGQVGYLRSAHDGCWYFDGFAKIGFGQMNRQVYIDDSNTGGLLANQQTNVGTFKNDTVVLVPEIGFSAAYLLTRNLHFTVGYSFLRLPKVTRVENALDPGLVVDTRNPPQALRPGFTFAEKNFDVHMLDLGLQLSY